MPTLANQRSQARDQRGVKESMIGIDRGGVEGNGHVRSMKAEEQLPTRLLRPIRRRRVCRVRYFSGRPQISGSTARLPVSTCHASSVSNPYHEVTSFLDGQDRSLLIADPKVSRPKFFCWNVRACATTELSSEASCESSPIKRPN